MDNPKCGELTPAQIDCGNRETAQRFDDEKEAEAFAASVDTPCRPIDQVKRLIIEAYLAALKKGRKEGYDAGFIDGQDAELEAAKEQRHDDDEDKWEDD